MEAAKAATEVGSNGVGMASLGNCVTSIFTLLLEDKSSGSSLSSSSPTSSSSSSSMTSSSGGGGWNFFLNNESTLKDSLDFAGGNFEMAASETASLCEVFVVFPNFDKSMSLNLKAGGGEVVIMRRRPLSSGRPAGN